MDLKLTTRSQETLSEAVQRATVDGNPHVEPAHLTVALLGADGTTRPLLHAVGVDPQTVLPAAGRPRRPCSPPPSGRAARCPRPAGPRSAPRSCRGPRSPC